MSTVALGGSCNSQGTMACNSVLVQGTEKKNPNLWVSRSSEDCFKGADSSSFSFILKGWILMMRGGRGIDLGRKGSLVTELGWGSNGYTKKVKVTQSCPALCDPM